MKDGRAAVYFDCSLKILDGLLVLAHLARKQSEVMDHVGVIRHNVKNLSINLLGSLQAASLLVLDGHCQCFGNRCHNVDYDKPTWQSQDA
jgi:hypothetical protein